MVAFRRQYPEAAIQKAVVDHLRARGVAGLVYWHMPSGAFFGGKRSRKGKSIQGGIMKGIGWRPGVSDLILVHAGKIFALEIKALGGRTSEAQLQFISDMEKAGAFTCVAEGLDAALKTLETWGLLRGTVS